MSYHVRHYNNRESPEGKIIESILKIIWWVLTLPFRMLFGKKSGLSTGYSALGTGGLDRGFIQAKLREIETLLKLGSPSNYSRAVLEADKLLDHVLKGYRAPGMTMGDRLKASKNRFSPEGYDAAWRAHKVRNELVHNAQYDLMDYQAKDTINNFKKALDELL